MSSFHDQSIHLPSVSEIQQSVISIDIPPVPDTVQPIVVPFPDIPPVPPVPDVSAVSLYKKTESEFHQIGKAIFSRNYRLVAELWESSSIEKRTRVSYFQNDQGISLIHLICYFTPRGHNSLSSPLYSAYSSILFWICDIQKDGSGFFIQNHQSPYLPCGSPVGLSILNHQPNYIRALLMSCATADAYVYYKHGTTPISLYNLACNQDPHNQLNEYLVGDFAPIREYLSGKIGSPFNCLQIELEMNVKGGLLKDRITESFGLHYAIKMTKEFEMCRTTHKRINPITPELVPRWICRLIEAHFKKTYSDDPMYAMGLTPIGEFDHCTKESSIELNPWARPTLSQPPYP